MYGAEHARNLGAGSLDGGYNADFGGIVFGGDYAFGDFRVGMALNAGSGTARSRGDFNATKNDFDFWGMNLYGSWSRDQFNIVGDLGYSANKNEVKQDLPATMQLGQLRADVDTGVLGVAASDTIKARMMDSVSFDGTLGPEVQKDNISFGLDYGIRASEHKAGHGVNVSFTYKF